MRKLLVVLTLVLAAVVLPTVAGPVPDAEAQDCQRGVVLAGRCVRVDRRASVCVLDSCVEFIEEVVDVCPEGTTPLAADPVDGVLCELTEAATQRDDSCPEGARGSAGACFIYVAIGPDGCPGTSFLDATNNCWRPVADARGAYYCERDDAELSGLDCIAKLAQESSACPAGTDRFDGACWQLNGLTPPETCDGHEVVGTVELADGRCQVPLTIPTGAATCIDGAQYREHPIFVLISSAGQPQGDGPTAAACVDDSASIGVSVRHCLFLDDDLDWGDYGFGDDIRLCTRFETPVTATCPAGFTIDDSAGGLCRRFDAIPAGGCPDGSLQNGPWCVYPAEFAVFDCPAGTERHLDTSVCLAHRLWQGSVQCGGEQPSQLLPSVGGGFGTNFGCFAHLGPQPDSCNGQGTIDDCFEIREPAAAECTAPFGCVALGDLDFNAGCAPAPDSAFEDVVANVFYETAVKWAACTKVTAGTSTTMFSPNDPVTRGQMATFLWRYAAKPDPGVHPFTDVPAGKFFTDPVGWLSQSGITNGTSDTTFSPDDTVTRAQMAAFVWRFSGSPAPSGPHPFTDVPAGSYYEVAVAWMAENGITTGTTDTTYSPNQRLSRAQAVTFLWRLAGQP